ncbi:MAG: ImmA/IrrE family metallo-endopeptidase [Ignavibacteria bacterium]|nr:ImmA/IrrE family metallo-endopeptidase [Ignavibacteria bacterium]
MSEGDLVSLISEGKKKKLTIDDVFNEVIDVNYLKRIDKIFDKGLHFYLDQQPLKESNESSIFFRKKVFAHDLNFATRKIVNHFEEVNQSITAIAILSDVTIERILPTYDLSSSPREVAKDLRSRLYPQVFTSDLKEFLRSLIDSFAKYNILVFEFVETWNRKEKVNIDGFFLKPNAIVLKRQQSSFRREIFTLVHELAHYLLGEEEIEEIAIESLTNNGLSDIEKWCNDFAYYFLVGTHDAAMSAIRESTVHNDYHHEIIRTISRATHLSRIALFTRLLIQNKISPKDYKLIKDDFEERARQKRKAERIRRERDKELGIQGRGSTPVAMNSPLLVSTLQTAYYEGVIDERQVCLQLNIPPKKLRLYIQ